MTSLRWPTSDAIMDATAASHREMRHAAPEPDDYDPINPEWLATSALMCIPDSRRTSREVRKVPITDVTSPLITHGPCAGVGQRARRELAVELVVNHPCDASPVDATGAGRQEAERADQHQGKPAGPTLSTTQLVENHRLDVERALVGEACAEASLINQPAEQVEIGVRRYHDVETAVGLQPLAGLLEQGRHVPILRAGVPTAIREIARLASMLGWA